MDRSGIGTFINNEFEVTTSALDIFSVPPVDAVLKDGRTVYYYPVNAISNSGPFEFILPKDNESWTLLPLTRLEGVIKLKKKDDSVFGATDIVSPVNLFPQSIFKQVECELNGIQVCDLSTPTYAFKQFIETHLTYSKAAKETHLENSLYVKDQQGKETTYVETENSGFKERRAILNANEMKFNFSNVIHSDFFQCQKALLPGVEIKLKFIRNDDNFSLLAASALSNTYEIEIKNLKLSVRRVKIDPVVQASIETTLKTKSSLYNITQSKIKTFMVPANTSSINFPSVIQGNLPQSVIFGFVSDSGFTGKIEGNPFCFGHHNINLFNAKINGIPILPTPFTPSYEANKLNFAREYRWFMDNCGISHENESNGITKKEFMTNSNFYVYDLTPDLCNSFHNHETKTGNLELDISFQTAPTNNIYLIVYASFPSVIAIDALRNPVVLE